MGVVINVINGCAHSDCRNLKLAVSRNVINELTGFCLSVLPSVCPPIRQFSIFLRNSIIFFLFLAPWQLIGIFKTDKAFFPEKFIFAHIWAKKARTAT